MAMPGTVVVITGGQECAFPQYGPYWEAQPWAEPNRGQPLEHRRSIVDVSGAAIVQHSIGLKNERLQTSFCCLELDPVPSFAIYALICLRISFHLLCKTEK